MKIAYLSFAAIPSRDAYSVHTMKMCDAFARNGHDTMLYALPGRDTDGDVFEIYGCTRGFRLERIPRVPVRGICGVHHGWRVVQRAERSFKPTLYYSRHVYALAQAGRSCASLVYEAHEPPSNVVQRHVLKMLFGMRRFRRLVVISEALRREYGAMFSNLDACKVVVAHDAADLPAAAGSMPAGLPGRAEAFKVGYVGALYPGKGMEVISEIAPLLPDMDFHIVGGEDSEIAEWRRRTPAPNAIFHGYRPHSETSGLAACFDAVLLPLQHRVCSLPGGRGDIGRWTSPMKLFEYMAHGKPIVTSDLPVLREVVEPERNALVAPAQDPQAWVRALRRLANDPGLRRRLGDAARADLELAYTWDKRVERVLDGLNQTTHEM